MSVDLYSLLLFNITFSIFDHILLIIKTAVIFSYDNIARVNTYIQYLTRPVSEVIKLTQLNYSNFISIYNGRYLALTIGSLCS